MRPHHVLHRISAAALVAIFATATLAPLAEAAHRGKVRRYKGGTTRVVETVRYIPVHRSHVRYYHRHSDAAPLIAGLIGGFILGAATSNAAPPVRYVYWDPYCERSYGTFSECRAHWGNHDGPRIVYQVETRTGRCVDAWRYADGDWHRWDGNPAGWDDDRDEDFYR